jgi:hypothetical protein
MATVRDQTGVTGWKETGRINGVQSASESLTLLRVYDRGDW